MSSAVPLSATQSFEDVQGARRAQEFHRYLHPANLTPFDERHEAATSEFEDVPNLSQVLAPLCQLTLLQCRAKKAMINCMDQDVMYFLTEASAESKIVDGKNIQEFIHDPILASCMSVPLKGRICEMTINLADRPDKRPPLFIVPDLSKSQFSHMAIVSGPPYYRFYAGMPIKTKNGVNIGSLAIMDDQPRQCLTRAEEDFMRTIVTQIAAFLETNRQALESIQTRRMMKGLTNFISQSANPTWQESTPMSTGNPTPVPQNAYCVAWNQRSPMESLSPDQLKNTKLPPPSYDNDISARYKKGSAARKVDAGVAKTFTLEDSDYQAQSFALKTDLLHRAAISVVECLDLHESSSVIFYNVRTQKDNAQASDAHSNIAVAIQGRGAQRSHADLPELKGDFIRILSERHPKGCLWNLGVERGPAGNKPLGEQIEKANDNVLSDKGYLEQVKIAFPSARQALFVPILDTDSVHPSFCLFIQSCETDRYYNTHTDLSFLHAFCSTISTDIARIEAWRGDKHQGDFVANISHELRSPLHGIVACTQFLHDSGLTDFQRTMLTTIDHCSETLLDTLNNVLDYSKINAFEKQWSNIDTDARPDLSRGKVGSYQQQDPSSMAPPLLRLFAVTDVSAILEQVVDGLVLSDVFDTTFDIIDVSREARGKAKKDKSRSGPGEGHSYIVRPRLVIDVEKGDWFFMTQPGAVRRIMSNLVDNSLKYTREGLITISLRFAPSEDCRDSEVVLLTVTDTGIGMSQRFQDTKLYVPFAQENYLSPGTGLGLSIVRSIATMMGGTVEFKSSIGKGTIASVKLPLQRPTSRRNSMLETPDSTDSERATIAPSSSHSIQQVDSSPVSISLYGSLNINNTDLRRTFAMYMTDWFHLSHIVPWRDATMVSLIVDDLEAFLHECCTLKVQPPAILALYEPQHGRHLASIASRIHTDMVAVQYVSIPIGPHKLAKAIKVVTERYRKITAHESELFLSQGDVGTPTSARTLSQRLETNSSYRTSENGSNSTRDTASQRDPRGSGMIDFADPLTQPSTQTSNSICSGNQTDGFPFPSQSPRQDVHLSDTTDAILRLPAQSTGNPRVAPSSRSGAEDAAKSLQQISLLSMAEPRILIVDDNAINLRLLETYLRKKRGYTNLVKAANGQEAVDAFVTAAASTSSQLELIFMDISMPIMNGFDATRKIREHESILQAQHSSEAVDPPLNQSPSTDKGLSRAGAMIIALTGLASGKDQAEGFECGLDMYLTKPVVFRDLSKILDNWESHRCDSQDKSIQNKLCYHQKPVYDAAATT